MYHLLVEDGSPYARREQAWSLRWLPALGISVAICLLTAGAIAAFSARQDAWRLAVQQSGNLRLALQRDIGRNVTVFDLSLQGVIEALAEPGIKLAPPIVRHQALFDRAAGAEDLGSIVISGPDGRLIESSKPLPRGLTLAGRPEFEIHRRHADIGLHLGRASRDSFDSNQLSMSISRRIPSTDGGFAGIVLGNLRLSFFKHLFDQIDIGPNGSILLVRTDGPIVWRYPDPDGKVDRDLSGSESFLKMAASPAGQFVGTSAVDGVTRLYSFGRVGSLPLVISVNLAVDDIYARWREKALIIGPALAVMCFAIVLLSLLFRREMLRRAAAEQALEEAAVRLSHIASTDALTGLANRRTFEEKLDHEWYRAIGERSNISLLMIDADHFKSFNDLYGHQAGDLALNSIAGAIKASLSRPADLAARYGGEEFVVLLPACDAKGARLVAERVLKAVEALKIAHTESAIGHMTVSVGIATKLPVEGDRAHDLLKAADIKLYEAKRIGRNIARSTAGAEFLDSPLAPVF